MNGYIHCSNTRARTFNRIRINADGVVTEAAQVIQAGLTTINDLVFNSAGDAYCAWGAANVLSKASTANGKTTTPVGHINDAYLAAQELHSSDARLSTVRRST